MRLVNAVQNQIGQRNRINRVVFLPPKERPAFQDVQLRAGNNPARAVPHKFKALRQKSAGAATGIIDRLANLRRGYANHDADNFARRKELPAVVALLAHFQEQPFIDLGEREYVRRVHRVIAQGVNLVQHVAKVLLGINPALLHARHDFADDLLAR